MNYTVVAKMDGPFRMWVMVEPELTSSILVDDVIRDRLGTLKFMAGRHADGTPILSTVNGQIKRLETK